MEVMRIKDMQTNVLCTVVALEVEQEQEIEYRAIQLCGRLEVGSPIYAATVLTEGDLVLVCEVPHFLHSPSGENAEDSVSHIIVGLVPPSVVVPIAPGLTSSSR